MKPIDMLGMGPIRTVEELDDNLHRTIVHPAEVGRNGL